MRVAIGGSTGFLGRHLAERLRARGDEVIPLVRPSTRASGVAWDPVAGTLDTAALAGVDAVVNLAGHPVGRRWTRGQRARIWTSRVDATRALCASLAAMPSPPEFVIGASAIGYYGERGTTILDESSPPGSGFLAGVCRAWEAANAPARAAGIAVATIRTGIVLGLGGDLMKRLLPIFKLGLGGRLGSGMHYQSWISLEDHMRALLFLLDERRAGAFNLTGPDPVTNAEFTRALAAVLRRPAFLAVPAVALRIVLGNGFAREVTSSQRVMPRALLDAGFTFAHTEVGDALRWALS
ncbi:MAG TPA: TIGR01777 family oxidoreductase [Actinomycetota bacterium]